MLLLGFAVLALFAGVTSGDASKMLSMSLIAWGIVSIIKYIPLDK